MNTESDKPARSGASLKFPINFLKIRDLFQNQKLFFTALQPHNRSFSQPELRTDLITQYKSLRDIFVDNTLKVQEALNCDTPISRCNCSFETRPKSRCDASGNESDQSIPPVPKPRKSVLHRRQNKDAKKVQQVVPIEVVASSQFDNLTEIKLNDHERTTSSNSTEHKFTAIDPVLVSEVINKPTSEVINASKSDSTANFCVKYTPSSIPLPTVSEKFSILPSILSQNEEASMKTKTPIKVKAKHSFRQLLRINKITSNKFLSIRLNKDSLSRKKSLFNSSSDRESYKPQRPTRLPPPPPILVFRPAAPLPKSDSESDLPESDVHHFSSSSQSTNRTNYLGVKDHLNDGDDISELYHDAFNSEFSESIYCSVDEIMCKMNDIAKVNDENQILENGKLDFDDQNEENNDYDETAIDEFGYYDDGECIYEELSSNDGTIYEEYIDDDENVYDNADAVVTDKTTNDTKKQLKRLKKVQKMMKRFHLNGDEIPVNAGIIKQDNKGSKNDLLVRQGETVLILRMVNNPPGKWLAKNERSKIGYVDLDNVYFDTESIKAVIKSFHNI